MNTSPPRLLKVALLASLLVNALLAGSVYALWQRGAAAPVAVDSEAPRGRAALGPEQASRHLHDEERAKLREMFRTHRPQMGERFRATRAARGEVIEALRARPFDPARLDTALADLRTREGEAAAATHAMMGELARELDDAGRARMADGMERRRRGERGERGQARRDGG